MTSDDVFAPEMAALYLHVPFCKRKCHFCDFTVQTNSSADYRTRYVAALRREITQFATLSPLGTFLIDAIYIGGGTPGLLESDQLCAILNSCRESFRLSQDCEICIEFDPSTVTVPKLKALVAAGCNRVSMGIQTFDEELLEAANRPHNLADVYRALDAIAEVGMSNLNLDLIYPLPGLTFEMWLETVRRTLEIHPACISLYGLEVWPGTAYHRWLIQGKLGLPDAGAEVRMYLAAVDELERSGYVAQSTNGFVDLSLAPVYCRYLNYYWRSLPLLGFGVSSRSAVDLKLWRNVSGIRQYIEMVEAGRLPADLGCIMTRQQQMRRFIIRGLKACAVRKADFLGRFGVELLQIFGEEISELAGLDLVRETVATVELTRKGRAYAPNVYHRFYTPSDLTPPAGDEVRYGISALIDS